MPDSTAPAAGGAATRAASPRPPRRSSRHTSPHHADVFSHLPSLLMRELDTPPVAALLERLVQQGWRAGQLRHRVGAEPSQGSVTADAAHLHELLERLLEQECPDALHARERAEQQAQRAYEQPQAPQPADPEVRDRWISEIRASLRSTPPRRRSEHQVRVRADCALCSAESVFFVRRDVHLCRRCVDLLATGEARLSATG